MDDSNLGPVVPAQRGVRDHARSEVLCRYAKLMRNGRPVFCTPSVAELSGRVPPKQSRGTDGKVIYPTREAAEAAARELEELGARALRPYVCGRSRRGHYHLTTDHTSRTPSTPAPRTPVDARPADAVPAAGSAEAPGAARTDRGPAAQPARITPLHLRIPRQAGPRAS